MDELTLTPVSKKEETPQENKPSADSFEMAPISLNTNNGVKDETAAAFEELDAKDIKSLMEQEKLERQKAKEAAANPAPAPAPAPVKPQGSENAKNKITEIMLTPPEELKMEEPKAEEKPQEKKEEKPQENQNKGGNQNNNNNNNSNKNNNNKNKNKNNKGGNNNNKNNNNKPAPAPAPKADEMKKEEVKKGIEEIKIPDAMMNEDKKVESAPSKPQNQSNLESIETKKPVLVDVDANVAQAVGGMSFNEEFALLVKKEEQDNLTPDESRRLKICRLIDMKRKGKPFSDVAQTNFNKFMDEERKAGHDISTFEAAMADIAIATAAAGKTASNPSVSNLAPINNTKPSAPAPKPPVQKKEESKASTGEKMGSDNKVLFIVIGIIAVLLIGLLAIIFAGKGKDTPDTPVDTTVVTEETTTTAAETTTPKAETTPILSVNNITKATVLEVITPDTLKVLLKDNTQATVKLIGVKAPVDNEYYAKESLEYTKNALTSKNINLEFDQKLTDDEHNILAYVWTNDGKTLFNDELILMGYAKTNLDEEDNVKFNEEFKRVEEDAKTAKKGVWGYVAPVYTTTKKPAIADPYISRNLKVFHKNTCPLAYDTKYGRYTYTFKTREEAIRYGCSPCSQCQP